MTCRRRATRLPENVTWTDRDNPVDRRTPVTAPKSLIYDPDPSLIRAGLLDGFAQAHQLGRVADGVDYLTSGHLVASPFLSAFELLEVSSLDLKALNRLIAKHQVGTLDIKVRGIDVTPEALREIEAGRSARGHATGAAWPRHGKRKRDSGSKGLDGRIGDFFGRG